MPERQNKGLSKGKTLAKDPIASLDARVAKMKIAVGDTNERLNTLTLRWRSTKMSKALSAYTKEHSTPWLTLKTRR
ncbi:hypothetical protein Nepgr_010966 [Nepenthes gracilis]|uniref:Uncharacterized protein n=1 Tax=Nepenthes gracilis TaxID=150966 RepID=A0AAD3SE72_NEPGR|nr:hypothetical protein Nepgr_010966 [Nepenthes gracilis]